MLNICFRKALRIIPAETKLMVYRWLRVSTGHVVLHVQLLVRTALGIRSRHCSLNALTSDCLPRNILIPGLARMRYLWRSSSAHAAVHLWRPEIRRNEKEPSKNVPEKMKRSRWYAACTSKSHQPQPAPCDFDFANSFRCFFRTLLALGPFRV